jgi:hypothetical protein
VPGRSTRREALRPSAANVVRNRPTTDPIATAGIEEKNPTS